MSPIRVVIGLNISTWLITAVLAGLQALVLVFCAIGSATKGNGEWLFALKFLCVMVGIWLICFFVTLAICRKKLIVTDSNLIVMKGRDILYETPLKDITWFEYDFFAPITRSQVGEMLFAAKRPKPNGLHLYIGWISYKRIEKRIKGASTK